MQVRDCYTQDPRSVTSVRDYADPSSDRPARRWLCDIIGKIQHYGHSLGKRDKLQLFLCLAARYVALMSLDLLIIPRVLLLNALKEIGCFIGLLVPWPLVRPR